MLFTNDELKTTMIKRIIAMPGDTIQIINGVIYINAKPSLFLSEGTILTYSGIASSPLHLSEDEYFVLGDVTKNH